MNRKPAFIEFFCGCGGFTLGMERAGFRCGRWRFVRIESVFYGRDVEGWLGDWKDGISGLEVGGRGYDF